MKRARRDLPLLFTAAGLLLAPVFAWLWLSQSANARREATLATVPEFPSRQSAEKRRSGARARALVRLDAGVAIPPEAPRTQQFVDPLASFLAAPAPSLGVVQVNALLNTPLLAKIREYVP